MYRKKRIVSEVSRDRLSDAYIKNMVCYLHATKNISKSDAEAFVKQTVTSRAKLPNFDVIYTVRSGELKRRSLGFSEFIDIITNNIITPSGSVYIPVNKIRSIVSSLIREGLAFRSSVKKKMFKALADNDKNLASKYKAEQNSIKTKLNALPGGFGSPSNLFYDKGGYNSVTSTARMLISNSFTCCEQFLGGNLPIFNVGEIYNLTTLMLEYGPSEQEIKNVVNNYNLFKPSLDDLIKFLNTQIKMYEPDFDIYNHDVYNYLKKLPEHLVWFFFYHSNLKNIILNNDKLFRDHITEMFKYDLNDKIDDSIVAEDFYKCRGDILAIVTTIVSKELESIKIKDIVDLHKDKARLCVHVYNRLTNYLNYFNDLFSTFIFHDINFQLALHRSYMQRKTVVVSDTDSVIYTAKDWAEWYVGSVEKITHDSYNIAALMTYWLTEANADTMAKYIIGIGAIDEDIATIQMKNEFLYPTLLLFDIKKVYAGIIKVQEGVLLPEPKPDIKGASIRGAGASAEAKEFAKKIIIDDILNPVINGNVSARYLIEKTISFERDIYSSLQNGELRFLPIVSVGTSDSYEDEDASAFFYSKAWNYIFGKKYGEIKPPDKLPLVKISEPNELYLSQLKMLDEDIYNRFKKFIEENGKVPSAFFIERTQKRIPIELMPLVNYKTIIYFNVNPVYLTLGSLNINVGNSNKQMLMGDIYDC